MNVPLSGVFTTLSCGGPGGVQVNDPESCADGALSAVASATGFAWDLHAAAGVVGPLVTVTVTDPCGGIVPNVQFSRLPTIGVQLPCVVLALDHARPPLPGSWSLNMTLVADGEPKADGFLTTMVKLTLAHGANEPLSGVFTTLSCGEPGGGQVNDPEACATARRPPWQARPGSAGTDTLRPVSSARSSP